MEKIIISLTSYPQRMSTINLVIDRLIQQTVKADKIILYLSSKEFDDKKYIENKLEKYAKNGFEIRWVDENLRSYKKFFYAIQEYPSDIIITVDDDAIYSNKMIEELLFYHDLYPRAVIARRTHLMTFLEDRTVAPYNEWYHKCPIYVGVPRMDLVATGLGGVLYPPAIFDCEVLNKAVFMKESPYADDLWLKIMELRRNVPTVLAKEKFDDPLIEEIAINGLYQNVNKYGANDVQFKNLIEIYGSECMKNIQMMNTFLVSDVEQEKNIIRQNAIKNLVKKLSCYDEIVVYGAGNVARKIYKLIDSYNTMPAIKLFVVNDTNNNDEYIGAIPVKDYRTISTDNVKILIALWHEKQNEVKKVLMEKGFKEKNIIIMDEVETEALILLDKIECDSVVWKGNAKYWDERYRGGGTSGAGSYHDLAKFKADVLNDFVNRNGIQLVIEWGCGDGNQLALSEYQSYIGYDVSEKAVEICKKKFENDATKKFEWCGEDSFEIEIQGDLALSLDVIYHLVEDEVYDVYMRRLFASSTKYICIYSSNFDASPAPHVRNRKFTEYVKEKFPTWRLIEIVKNKYPYDDEKPNDTSWSDFYFFKKEES